MRRLVCFILILAAASFFAGCGRSQESIRVPASFYYCTPTDSYETTRQVIASEQRESEVYSNDIQGLLNLYLQGPTSSDLVSPFPDSVRVEAFLWNDSSITVALSSRFARLTGMDLTLACACISMTLMEYTSCETVTVYVQNVLLDGNESITMSRDSLIFTSLVPEKSES